MDYELKIRLSDSGELVSVSDNREDFDSDGEIGLADSVANAVKTFATRRGYRFDGSGMAEEHSRDLLAVKHDGAEIYSVFFSAWKHFDHELVGHIRKDAVDGWMIESAGTGLNIPTVFGVDVMDVLRGLIDVMRPNFDNASLVIEEPDEPLIAITDDDLEIRG